MAALSPLHLRWWSQMNYVCMYVCMHACMHVCMYICVYIYQCMYIYIHTYRRSYKSAIQHAPPRKAGVLRLLWRPDKANRLEGWNEKMWEDKRSWIPSIFGTFWCGPEVWPQQYIRVEPIVPVEPPNFTSPSYCKTPCAEGGPDDIKPLRWRKIWRLYRSCTCPSSAVGDWQSSLKTTLHPQIWNYTSFRIFGVVQTRDTVSNSACIHPSNSQTPTIWQT